jgi:hypothetical protein
MCRTKILAELKLDPAAPGTREPSASALNAEHLDDTPIRAATGILPQCIYSPRTRAKWVVELIDA